MKEQVNSLRRLFMDGLLIAIPVGLLGILAYYAVTFFTEVVRPLVDKLPVDSVLGLGVLTICAILAVILVILLFGLWVRWRGARFFNWLEKTVLIRIPPYHMIKMVSKDVVDPDGADLAALIDLDGTGARCLGLVMEKIDEENAVVFVPNAPSVNTGRVYVVPNERVELIDGRSMQVMDVLGNRGIGTAEVLTGDPKADGGPENVGGGS